MVTLVVSAENKTRYEKVVSGTMHEYAIQTGDVEHNIRGIQTATTLWIISAQTLSIDNWVSEWSAEEQAELRRRYKQAHERPPTAEFLRNAPDLLDPDFG